MSPVAAFSLHQERPSLRCAPARPAMAAAPCGRGGGTLTLVLVALSAAFLTYNVLISFRSSLQPLPSSFPTATASASPSRRFGARRRAFHTAVTASGNAYNTWQCRVMYHWFKEARRALGGGKMGGFTRVLQSGKPDEFVDEIPTFVADPLPDGDQVYCCFFASRNGKVRQFIAFFVVSLWFAVAG